jgi:hypothetical protein
MSDHDLALHLQAQCEALRAELREVSAARDALLLAAESMRARIGQVERELREERELSELLCAALEDAKRAREAA